MGTLTDRPKWDNRKNVNEGAAIRSHPSATPPRSESSANTEPRQSTGELVWLTAVAADADNFRIASMRPDDREAPLTFYFAHQYCMIRAAPGRVYGRSHSAFFNITFASEGESHE